MKRYLFLAGVLIVVIGGVWIYSVTRQKNEYTGMSQEFTDKGFSVSQNGQTVSADYIADKSNLNLGIAVYPRAQMIEDKDAAESINLNGIKILAATYSTTDDRIQVETYYKNQIGSDAIAVEAVQGNNTYRVIKSSANIGSFVTVWVDGATTYFTIVKPV